MLSKSNNLIILFLLFLMTSCSQEAPISTFTVSSGSFINSMLVEGFVEPVNSTSIILPPCDGTILSLVEDGEYVEEGQVVCVIEWQTMEGRYDQMLMLLENAELLLVKTKADLNLQLALLEAQVKTNDADTRIAQMDSLQIQFLSLSERLIKELELEKTSIEKERYTKKLAALKIIQQSEIKKLELEIVRLKLNVEKMKEQLDALTIKAPQSGIILRGINPITGTKLNIGDPVWARFTVATIPKFDQMKVKILASESDFKAISVNDSVFYTFDAMPGNSGKGKILKKAPIGQPYKRGSTVKFFEIEASIDTVLTMPEPGFTANCRIILKQADDVISVPQIAVYDDDSLKVVFVKSKKGYEKRQVLTGITSPKESIITAGLEEGDVIALSKPKLSSIKGLITLPDSLTQKPETPVDSLKPENAPGFPPGMVTNMPQRIVQP